MEYKLRYGDTTVMVPIEGAEWVGSLTGRPAPPIEDLKAAFLQGVAAPVQSPPLQELIGSGDEVTVVISDITRFWMRQDLVVTRLVEFLHGRCGVGYDKIVILIALGTHRAQTEQELKTLVTPALYEKVRVVNHDCLAGNLVEVGVTSFGTRVLVNPLVVGRKVITIGGTVHHLMAGFGGGRKSILPGVCAKSTINQNHLHSLSANGAHSSELIGMGALAGNPLNEDMVEAAALVSPVFGINILVNDQGRHCGLVCGHHHYAWLESCRLAQDYFGAPIDQKADIVVAGCGGFPKDINLYQATKTLLNAFQAVKHGGTIVMAAQCREGGGAPEFFDWIGPLSRGTLDRDLRADFGIPGYIFYAACECTANARLLLLTEIPPQTVAPMGIEAFTDVGRLLEKVDFTGKSVYVMEHGGTTVPYLRQ